MPPTNCTCQAPGDFPGAALGQDWLNNLWAQYKTKIQGLLFKKKKRAKVPLKTKIYSLSFLPQSISHLICHGDFCFLFGVLPQAWGHRWQPSQGPAIPTLHNLRNWALTYLCQAPLPPQLPYQHVEPGISPSHGPVPNPQWMVIPKGMATCAL